MPTYIVKGLSGEEYGPATELQVTQWAREGRINAVTPMTCLETGQTLAAHMVPALSPIVGLPPAMLNELARGAAPAGLWPAAPSYSPAAPLAYAGPVRSDYAIRHTLSPFSVAAVVVLHLLTSGLFSIIYFPLLHGRMPQIRRNDPSAGKAFGFLFIPLFNIYWYFFVFLRLEDRINEQRGFAGLSPRSHSGLFVISVVLLFVPLLNFIAALVLMPTYLGCLQSSINELAAATPREDELKLSGFPIPSAKHRSFRI
jgi:hypothetical protein